MPIITPRDQQVISEYNAIAQRFLTGRTNALADVTYYRQFMAEIDNTLFSPPNPVLTPVASFVAERPLRAGLTAAIAVPRGAGPFPILIHAHGHGLRAGHPRDYEPWMRMMAAHGFVVVFPDFRLQPEATYDDQIDDMMFTIRWAKDNARSINAAVDRVVIGGDSAGGALAFDILQRQLDNPSGERFRAYICVDGQMNGPRAEAMLEKLTPQTPLPPIYMIAGSADVNAGQPVLRFAMKLMQLRKDFQLDCPYGMPHDFIKMAQMDAAREYNKRMMDFLKSATA